MHVPELFGLWAGHGRMAKAPFKKEAKPHAWRNVDVPSMPRIVVEMMPELPGLRLAEFQAGDLRVMRAATPALRIFFKGTFRCIDLRIFFKSAFRCIERSHDL